MGRKQGRQQQSQQGQGSDDALFEQGFSRKKAAKKKRPPIGRPIRP
jgi:hypothetical protein